MHIGQLQVSRVGANAKCGLTPRSSGRATAWPLGRAAALFIIVRAAQGPRRCAPLNSNVRPHMPTTALPVTLREITAETVRAVIKLSVAESQKGFVAPNAVSLAQALFAPEAWFRAIYFGEEPAGFVMLEDESLLSPAPPQPEVGVWRFMVDAKFQGRGIGRTALLQVIEHVRSKAMFASLQLSYVPGPGCPEPFYLALGFRHTGRLDEDEIILELPLAANAA